MMCHAIQLFVRRYCPYKFPLLLPRHNWKQSKTTIIITGKKYHVFVQNLVANISSTVFQNNLTLALNNKHIKRYPLEIKRWGTSEIESGEEGGKSARFTHQIQVLGRNEIATKFPLLPFLFVSFIHMDTCFLFNF